MSKLKEQIDKNRASRTEMTSSGGKSLLKQQIDASRSGTTYQPSQSEVGRKVLNGQKTAASDTRKELFTTGSQNIKHQRAEYQKRTAKKQSPSPAPSAKGGSRNAAQARSGKSRERYDSSVRDRLTQQRAAKGGQRSTLNTNEDTYDWVGQRAVRKKADKKGSDMDGWKLLEGMAVKGGAQFAEGIASTLDLAERQLLNAQEVFMPTGGERVAQGGPFRALHQAVKQNRIDAENYYNPNVEKGGTPAKVADFLGTITAEAIPQGAVAAISAGAKVAQVGVDVVTKAEQLAPGLWNSIRTVAGNAAKNPAFWSSFMQTVGNDYEEAISDGASEWKAVSYALTNGLLNAGIEVGGGLETMDPAKGFGVKDWVKSAVEEGNEEVGQGIVQRGLQNLVYQKGNPLASVTDGDAVLNPMTSAQEWSGGAFAGGVLSGARIGANYIGKQIYQQQLADVGAEYRSAPEALVERGLSFPEETQAHRTAAQMQEKMNAGTALTDTDLGEMVAANERARVQQRRLEWANTPARERENIVRQTRQERQTRQAVARGQLEQVKVTFGEHGARALTAMYDAEQDTGKYAGGFAAAYQAGLTGKGLEEVPGRYAGALTRAQAQAAYYAGENDRALSLRREKLAAQYAPAAGADSGLVYDEFVRQAVESGRTQEDVNGEERVYLTAETAERVNTVAKALGLRAQFVDSVAGGKANAQISGDTVLLERDNPNPVLFLMGHEAAHRMQQLAPTEYRAFRDIAVAEYGPEVVQRRIDDYAAQGVSLTWEGAMDEVAADKAGQLMDGGAVLDEFIRAYRENKPLLEKLRDAIRSFIAKLTGREKKKAQTAQGKLTAALEAAAKQAESLETNKNAAQTDGEVRYSINEQFRQDIQEWADEDRPAGERFILGSTGPVLQGLGAIESDIYMNGDKINLILEQHPEMTLREIKRIPEMLEDPVMILKSRNAGRGVRNNTRMVVFSSIKANDGRPVLCVLDLRPNEHGFVLDDMQRVTSAYTKDTKPVEFIKSSDVMFADKKRTTRLLSDIGFQAPISCNRSGYIGSIAYARDNVKLTGIPFSDMVDTTQALQGQSDNGTMAAKYSLKGKYWRPNLSGKEWGLLNHRMDAEINDPAHALDEATQWAYADEKGTAVFAIYGIGDGTEVTPLYAVGGKKARAAYELLVGKMEGAENGIDGNGKDISSWVNSVWGNQEHGRRNSDAAGRAGGSARGTHQLHGGASERNTEGTAGTGNRNGEVSANEEADPGGNGSSENDSSGMPRRTETGHSDEKRSVAVRKLQEAHPLHSDVQSTPEGDSGRDQVRESNLQGPGDKAKHSLKTGTLTKSYSAILEENRLLREQTKDYLALQRRNRALEASRDYWQGQTRRSQQVTTDRKAVEKAAKGLSTC